MFPWVSACGHTIISLKWAYEQVNDSRISPDCRSSPSVGALYYCMHLHFTSDCRHRPHHSPGHDRHRTSL